MTLEQALEVAERLEKEDCIGTTSLALRTLLRAYTELEAVYYQHTGFEYRKS